MATRSIPASANSRAFCREAVELLRASDTTGALVEDQHHRPALVLTQRDSLAGGVGQAPGRSRPTAALAATLVAVVAARCAAAALTRVEDRCGISDTACADSRLGRLFIAVIFVAELRGTVSRADRQIHALAASVRVRELAIEVFGIGWILVAEPVPAFPEPVDVGVMEIEERVAADRGEVGHVAPEGDMSEEVRVLVEPGVEPKAAGRRVDVELLVEGSPD